MTSRTRPTWPLIAVLAALTLAADQASKAWALRALVPGDPRPLLGTFLQLELIHNSGAAFSFASGQTWLLTIVAVVIGVLVVRYAPRIRSAAWAVAAGFVLGGLLGNLYDRLFRPPSFGQGHVVDFLNYDGWFIGNVADIFIVAAAILVALLSVLGISYDGTHDGPTDGTRAGDETDGGATRA